MPNGEYVSEGARRKFEEITTTTNQAPIEGTIQFAPGKVVPGNPGVNNDLGKFADDQASYTGPEEGFFAKFGSDKVD